VAMVVVEVVVKVVVASIMVMIYYGQNRYSAYRIAFDNPCDNQHGDKGRGRRRKTD